MNMRSNLRYIFQILCLIFWTNCVHSTYMTNFIQHYCDENPDRRIIISDSGSHSALILGSANGKTESNLKCRVKIVGNGKHVMGFVITVTHIQLISDNCEDSLRFDDKIKWCRNEDANSTTFYENLLNIEFTTGYNSSSEFELVITSFNGIWNKTCHKPNTIRCDGGGQQCIYNGYECDGYSNCPLGSDERDCPILTTPVVEGFEDFVRSNTSFASNQSGPSESSTLAWTEKYDQNESKGNDTLSSKTNSSFSTIENSITSKTLNNESQTQALNADSISTDSMDSIVTKLPKLPITTNWSTNDVTTDSSNDIQNSGQTMTTGKIVFLIVVLISLIALISGTAIHMYKKHLTETQINYQLINE